MKQRPICPRRLGAGVVALTGRLWKSRWELVPTTGARRNLVRERSSLAPFILAGFTSITSPGSTNDHLQGPFLSTLKFLGLNLLELNLLSLQNLLPKLLAGPTTLPPKKLLTLTDRRGVLLRLWS